MTENPDPLRAPGPLRLHGPLRAVVIGAGIGGLAAALRLRAAGHAVTVVEAAAAPGGKARAVPSPAGPIDAGPTVLTLRQEFDDLFALFGQRAADHLDLVALPRLARHFWPDGSRLDLFPDAEANAAAIAGLCGPREADAFRRFDALARGLFDTLAPPVMRAPRPRLGAAARAALLRPRLWPALVPGRSLDGLLRSHFRDPRLVQLFGRYATYVGGRPGHAPAVLALIWRAESAGVWAVREGIHGLAQALARLAADQGVRFVFGTAARRIVRQSGRVSAVELASGPGLPCDLCLFNGDPAALSQGLLGEAAAAALPAARRPARPSLSAWVWAFAARPEGVELLHHNVFFTADPSREFGPIGDRRMPEAPTLYVCAQDRGAAASAPGPEQAPERALERFEIIMNAPAAPRPMDEEDSQCQTRTFPPLAAFGLRFHDMAPGAELTRPSDLARRFPGSQGAIYGPSPEGSLAAFRRPPVQTALAGLYLVGGGTHPGAGLPMAALSARHAAAMIAADPALTLPSRPEAMPGGMSTVSRTAMGTGTADRAGSGTGRRSR